MEVTEAHNIKIAKLTFASVYPHYLAKALKKGRTEEELLTVIKWLSGFSDEQIKEAINNKYTFDTFFQKTKLHPNAVFITGSICGYKIEEIENPLTKKVRYLDKLVDELAKGRPLQMILREK